MQPDDLKKSHYFRAAAVFVACLLAVLTLPVIAIYGHALLPSRLSDVLFFTPQFLFPYESLVIINASHSKLVFGHEFAKLLTFAQWSVVAVGFTLVCRRLRLQLTFFAAIAAIVGVGITTILVLRFLGMSVALDGP